MLDLGGLIKPGTVVRMTKSKPGGKTSHAVQLVQVLETECSVTRCYINSLCTIPFLGSAALPASSKDSMYVVSHYLVGSIYFVSDIKISLHSSQHIERNRGQLFSTCFFGVFKLTKNQQIL